MMHDSLRLNYTSIKISELFQISWIPSLFSMQNPAKTRRRPHNGFVEWVFSTLSLSLVCDLLGNIARFDFSYSGNSCG